MPSREVSTRVTVLTDHENMYARRIFLPRGTPNPIYRLRWYRRAFLR